eukprot:2011802-Rhodomonas_salina.6
MQSAVLTLRMAVPALRHGRPGALPPQGCAVCDSELHCKIQCENQHVWYRSYWVRVFLCLISGCSVSWNAARSPHVCEGVFTHHDVSVVVFTQRIMLVAAPACAMQCVGLS